MVSVIVPVYNGAEFVESCLRSIMDQSYRDLEIIVIDDGSTDDSYQICERLAEKDHRIRLVHQENAGVSAARNKGITVAQGQYIMFVDSDDLLLPDAFTDIEESFDMIIFDYVFVKAGKEYGKRMLYANHGSLVHDILDKNILFGKPGFVWGILYKKSFLDANNLSFREGCIHGEDSDFNFELITLNPKVLYVDRKIYRYNYSTQTSIARWRKNPSAMIMGSVNRYKRKMDYLEQLDCLEKKKIKENLVRSRIFGLYSNAIDLCCAKQDTRENRAIIEKLMMELDIPSESKSKEHCCYYMVINKKWGVIWLLAKVRMLYLWIKRI